MPILHLGEGPRYSELVVAGFIIKEREIEFRFRGGGGGGFGPDLENDIVVNKWEMCGQVLK